MKQRAGLARTLVADPRVILMDEPFSAVDHLTRLTLQDEMIRIWEKEKKTIFSSRMMWLKPSIWRPELSCSVRVPAASSKSSTYRSTGRVTGTIWSS